MRSEAIELSCTDEEIALAGILDNADYGIYPGQLVAGLCLTNALFAQYGLKVATVRLANAMKTLGWKNAGQAKWRGVNYKWYYKGEQPPKSVNASATFLESARKETLIDGDFRD